ncbi:Dynamin family protein [Modestobacter sp. DSM 44400]|uniref:dynamin family protein n=1 Tax=Modestobacter sp. DSM 44400 TaxID=1550230 RepID=UPI0008968F43|nr:dynamin family protein [Modestobacter sp. DSM 44400]SDY18176.1 Dynamin family protein [Modestobacter sp. DSM 44400]
MTIAPIAGEEATLTTDVRALLDRALQVYRNDPAAVTRLRAQRERLDEPLRVAVAGRVKAGKSTLLNALLGERLAPTDAGECTRVVTWYRRAQTPRVVLHGTDGDQRSLPVRRTREGLRLDLAGTPAEDVERLVVDWPAAGLASATWLDTPGISSLSVDISARTRSSLVPGDQLPGADAIIFLTRQMQPEDVAFLAAFQQQTGGVGVHTTTLTVLSRADDVGAGRLDALLAAERVAAAVAEDPAVRELTSAVIPVAGLVGLGGRTLRQADFVALRSLASADRAAVDGMLLTADRFRRPESPTAVSPAVRADLLERLGLFGVRLSVALIRTGVGSAATLADELVARSGLRELQRLVDVTFTQRGAQLKAGTALRTVERILQTTPAEGTTELWRQLEQISSGAHDLMELRMLAQSRSAGGPFAVDVRAEAERLLGAEGDTAAARLGLPEGSDPATLRRAAVDALTQWRARSADPLVRRPAADASDIVARSCETLLAGLDGLGSAAEPDEPGPGAPQRQRDQGDDEETALDEEAHPVDLRAAGDDALIEEDGDQAQEPPAGQQPARLGRAAQYEDQERHGDHDQPAGAGEEPPQDGGHARVQQLRRRRRILSARRVEQPET